MFYQGLFECVLDSRPHGNNSVADCAQFFETARQCCAIIGIFTPPAMSRAKLLFKSLKARLQTLRLKWGKRLLDRPPPPAPSDRIRSILFLRQDGKIGDAVVSSFVFREIKQARPDIRIGVLCNNGNRRLFAPHPHIDALYHARPKNLWDYWRTGRQLRGRYDAVIDPTVLLRNRDLLLLRLLAAPLTVGYGKADYRLFSRNIDADGLHFAEVYRRALECCGIACADTRHDLPHDAAVAARIENFLQTHGITDFTAVNFFGASRSRRFNDRQIRAFLTMFADEFPQRRFVLLGAPPFNAQLSALPLPNNVVCYPANDVLETAELIRRAEKLVSPDTAAVHLADAFGTPQIAFYREDPQNFAHWRPQSPDAKILFYKNNIGKISPATLSAALRV